MSVLPIVTAPDSRLKQKSLPVGTVNDTIRKLMDDMVETMYHDHGVGLAAIQIGIVKRILVVDLQNSDDTERVEGFYPLFIVDPEIIDKSKELVVALEGCLSLPEQQIEIARSESISIRFLDYNNRQQELKADGWLARVIQHEMDHLDGKLLVDYLSNIKKDIALRKLKKLKNNNL
ncbi:MAG TPA: peptide deformylase [Rickettsia endosymbiont of Sericostoma sp.]|jgi:peptide deformylase|uniref:peptide deformylase n=1 Tax=unclassified Candidatus Tisiphia TaxID=2996318 RepID=UPI001D3281BF|nr:peptide deformylase [Rickettsia endosymbiont of Sericostoma sp. HW-2014]HJD64459.1 peptide deformylase [Rickettsia endosymbiont of Sericostoma sp.]